jgi:hypothetical protein
MSGRRGLPAGGHGARALVAAAGALLLAACAPSGRLKIEPEAFGSTSTHARNYATAPAFTCEAARRALLSQGFVINFASTERVDGRKNFQPSAEVHMELDFHVVCAADGRGGKKSIAFVNALQDRYALKKSSSSASVGVGPLGSLSLPFSSSDDAMVKVASETITAEPFYDRFFALLQRYLAADADFVESKVEIVPLPEPAASAATPPRAPASAASAP